jgi:hypothetical protein
MARALASEHDELVLLPTYKPATDHVRYVQIDYSLAGYARLTARRAGAGYGVIPTAMVDAETAWTRSPQWASEVAADIATCGAFFGHMLDMMEPDTVCVWNPTVPQGRLLQAACLLRGIPCYGIERGVFPETMMIEAREVGAPSDLVVNPTVRSLLARHPAQPDFVDRLRERLDRDEVARYPMRPRRTARQLKHELGIPGAARTVVLFLSAAAANWEPRTMAGSRFVSPWFASAGQAIDALLAALPEGTHLVVQNHPIDRATFRGPQHPRVRYTQRENLRSLFEVADVMAFLGATTVQHDALLTGKPQLLLSRSQLWGQGVAYEFRGAELPALVARALRHEDRPQHAEAAARYIPFLYEHVLFGCEGGLARQTASDLARHLAGLASGHELGVEDRLQRWLTSAMTVAAGSSELAQQDEQEAA